MKLVVCDVQNLTYTPYDGKTRGKSLVFSEPLTPEQVDALRCDPVAFVGECEHSYDQTANATA